MKYFVSYTTRDKEITIGLLESFYSTLKSIGDVFVDMINNDSLDKQARVVDELDTCDIVILIETPSIYESEWVAFELSRAKSVNVPVYLIRIEDLKQFSNSDLLDYIHNFESAVNKADQD